MLLKEWLKQVAHCPGILVLRQSELGRVFEVSRRFADTARAAQAAREAPDAMVGAAQAE